MRKIDIEELFRANQHKLTERPSRQAWEKLEGRLDKHRGRHRIGRRNQYAMVAALLFLIAMAGAMSLFTNTNTSTSDQRSASIELEEMTNATSTKALKVVEFTRHHQERLAKPMDEGDSGKELVVK